MSQGNKPFVGSGVLKTPVLQAACKASRIETNRVVLTRCASFFMTPLTALTEAEEFRLEYSKRPRWYASKSFVSGDCVDATHHAPIPRLASRRSTNCPNTVSIRYRTLSAQESNYAGAHVWSYGTA